MSIHELVKAIMLRLDRLLTETAMDEILLQKITKYVQYGWPLSYKASALELGPFWGVYDYISIGDGLLMAGSINIIPEVSQPQVLRAIPEGH